VHVLHPNPSAPPGAAASAPIPELLASLQLAEAHQLAALRRSCLQLLARRLGGAGPFWREQISAAQLAECSPDSLAELVGEVAGAVRAGAFEPPQVYGIGRGRNGKAGGFTFVLRGFSRKSGRVVSPWVEVAGLEWRLKVWPRGNTASGGTHLSGEGSGLPPEVLKRGFGDGCVHSPAACVAFCHEQACAAHLTKPTVPESLVAPCLQTYLHPPILQPV